MIGGKLKENKTEASYRDLEINSYSTLKDFDNNRLKFYKKYILKDQSVQFDDEQEHIIIGNIVDVLETGNQEIFDAKFATIDTPKTSGQMADFGDELWRLSKQYMNEEGEISRDFASIAQDAFDSVKYSKAGEEIKFKGKKLEDVLPKFQGSPEEILYRERRRKFGRIIVTQEEVGKAEKIHDMLLSTPWTADILTHSNTEDYEVMKQLQIVFNIEGLEMKSMLDEVHIDNINKTIQPYDFKVSGFVNNFAYSYLKQKYYLQAAVYNYALYCWIFESELHEYTVLPMKFIVADSTLQSKPVIWKTSKENISEGMNGFILPSGRKYKGVSEIIEELKWCLDEQIWSTPKEVFDNNGEMEIKPFSELVASEE